MRVLFGTPYGEEYRKEKLLSFSFNLTNDSKQCNYLEKTQNLEAFALKDSMEWRCSGSRTDGNPNSRHRRNQHVKNEPVPTLTSRPPTGRRNQAAQDEHPANGPIPYPYKW
jgi:hypothetical protein